jgi:hypothetical protein
MPMMTRTICFNAAYGYAAVEVLRRYLPNASLPALVLAEAYAQARVACDGRDPAVLQGYFQALLAERALLQWAGERLSPAEQDVPQNLLKAHWDEVVQTARALDPQPI